MKRLRIAVIGVGHLGKEHARILAGMPHVELVGVADVNLDQAQNVARRLGTQAFGDYWPLLNLVDAASIVVPTSRHAGVAREFLVRGIPLLVEKPLAGTLHEANELAELAEQHGTVLQVGHIERFNPAYEELRSRPLRPQLIRAQRLGSFTGRSTDIGVVLDLMIHDIDLLLDLVGAPVRTVSAIGLSIFGGHEDVANARLEFANGCVADITASRASPVASRQMQVWAAEGYAELDFAQRRLTLVQPSAQVQQHGLDPARLDPASRARLREELFGRHLEMCTIDGKAQDQLTAELEHFVACVRTSATPRVSGTDARSAVAVAESIRRQIEAHGGNAMTAGRDGLLFPHPANQDVA
jgi:predicted dehydrogenase